MTVELDPLDEFAQGHGGQGPWVGANVKELTKRPLMAQKRGIEPWN